MRAQWALRDLIKAWHDARGDGLAEIPAATVGPLAKEFRHAVLAGLASVPGPNRSTAQRPSRDLLQDCGLAQPSTSGAALHPGPFARAPVSAISMSGNSSVTQALARLTALWGSQIGTLPAMETRSMRR